MGPVPIEDYIEYRNKMIDKYVDYLNKTTDSLSELSNGEIKTCKGLDDKKWIIWPEFPFESKFEADPMLFCDLYSGEFFSSTISIVQQAMYHLNRNINLKGYELLSQWYDFLGIDSSVKNDCLGWSQEYMFEALNTCWLDFYVQYLETGDGKPYIGIGFDLDPVPFEDYGY